MKYIKLFEGYALVNKTLELDELSINIEDQVNEFFNRITPKLKEMADNLNLKFRIDDISNRFEIGSSMINIYYDKYRKDKKMYLETTWAKPGLQEIKVQNYDILRLCLYTINKQRFKNEKTLLTALHHYPDMIDWIQGKVPTFSGTFVPDAMFIKYCNIYDTLPEETKEKIAYLKNELF